jgi:hypothetical protein
MITADIHSSYTVATCLLTSTPRRELANFVDSVYERLTPPISHRDHPFWKPQFPLFLAEEQQGRQAREAIKQRLLREDPHEALRQQIIDELRTEARTIERKIRLTEIRLAGENRSFAEGLSRVEETYRSRRAALESEFEPVRDKYENELRGPRKDLAALDAKRADFPDALGAVDQDPEEIPRPVPGTRWPQLIQFYHRAFGRLPATTNWRPYHTMLRAVLAALRTASETAEVLVVSSGGIWCTIVA